MKNVVIVGASLNSGNKGVNALTRGSITAILDYDKDVKITILSYTVDCIVDNEINYRGETVEIKEVPIYISPKRQIAACLVSGLLRFSCNKLFLRKLIQNYEFFDTADVVFDLTEGDSFSDIYGNERFFNQSWIKLMSIWGKKKIYLLPQTIGPFKNKLIKIIARYIIKKVSYTFTRDNISYDLVMDELKGRRDKVKVVPDMAFYMNPVEGVTIENVLHTNIDGTIVGFNISALLYYGGYNKNNMFSLKIDYSTVVKSVIKNFLKKEDVKIILIPHVTPNNFPIENDLVVSKEIYNSLGDANKERIFIVEKELREDELKSIIGQCDFFIGSRMHACIAALSTGVPNTPIAYSRKFIGIWKDLGLDICVADPRRDDLDSILRRIDSNFDNRESIRNLTKDSTKDVDVKIINIFRSIEL